MLSYTAWFPRFYSQYLWRFQDRTKLRVSTWQSIRFPVRLAPGFSRGCSSPSLGHRHPGTQAGVAAGAHLRKIAVQSEEKPQQEPILALLGRMQSRIQAWMQELITSRQLPWKPMLSCLHCNWHLINTASDMRSSL